MSSKSDIAVAKFLEGYNCAQGVRLILRYKLGKMTVNKERPEMLPAIA